MVKVIMKPDTSTSRYHLVHLHWKLATYILSFRTAWEYDNQRKKSKKDNFCSKVPALGTKVRSQSKCHNHEEDSANFCGLLRKFDHWFWFICEKWWDICGQLDFCQLIFRLMAGVPLEPVCCKKQQKNVPD